MDPSHEPDGWRRDCDGRLVRGAKADCELNRIAVAYGLTVVDQGYHDGRAGLAIPAAPARHKEVSRDALGCSGSMPSPSVHST